LSFGATSGRSTASGGDVLRLDGPVHLRAAANAPGGGRIALVKDGERIAVSGDGGVIEHDAPAEPGVYRVEVNVPGAPGTAAVPWIVSNPIYVGRGAEEPRVPPRPAASGALPIDRNMTAWTVEHNATSQGAVDIARAIGGGQQAIFRYALSGPLSSGPYAAMVLPAPPGLARYDRLTFRVRADRVMRVSVQVRAPAASNGERWHRSVVAGTEGREVSVFFNEMRPRGPTSTPSPALDRIGSILFVVDTVNTRSGTAGQLWIEDLRYEK